MSTVAPPPPPSTPSPAQPQAQLTLSVPNPPAALSELQVGARLDAVIAATGSRGLVELETALGRFSVQPNGFALPSEGPIQLQVLARGNQLLFLLTAIRGKPPQAAARALGLPGYGPSGGTVTGSPLAAAAGGTSATAGTVAASAPASVGLTVGSTVTATLQVGTPTSPAAAATTFPAPVATGTGTAQAVAGASASAPRTTSASPSGGGAVAASSTPSATSGRVVSAAAPGAGRGGSAPPSIQTGGVPPGIGGASYGPGSQFSLRVTVLQPPVGGTASAGPAPVSSLSLAPGSVVSGVVSGHTASGHSTVQTAAGTLSVATPTPVPVGTTVGFEVVSAAGTDPGTASAADRFAAHAILRDRRWPAVEEAVQTIRESHPTVAHQLATTAMPRADTALAANILLFLGAIRGGEVRAWMGDAPARVLQRLRPDVIGRLRDDFGHLARAADEPGGDWRGYPVPFLNGSEIEQIHLYLRRQRAEEDEEEPEGTKGTRFVVDLDLSQLGRFQLDGLIHRRDKRFDLIVRTEERLPADIQNGIREIFEGSAEVTGFKGGLSFQAAPPDFVDVTQSVPAAENPGLIV